MNRTSLLLIPFLFACGDDTQTVDAGTDATVDPACVDYNRTYCERCVPPGNCGPGGRCETNRAYAQSRGCGAEFDAEIECLSRLPDCTNTCETESEAISQCLNR